jgi:hypothetical protein
MTGLKLHDGTQYLFQCSVGRADWELISEEIRPVPLQRVRIEYLLDTETVKQCYTLFYKHRSLLPLSNILWSRLKFMDRISEWFCSCALSYSAQCPVNSLFVHTVRADGSSVFPHSYSADVASSLNVRNQDTSPYQAPSKIVVTVLYSLVSHS